MNKAQVQRLLRLEAEHEAVCAESCPSTPGEPAGGARAAQVRLCYRNTSERELQARALMRAAGEVTCALRLPPAAQGSGVFTEEAGEADLPPQSGPRSSSAAPRRQPTACALQLLSEVFSFLSSFYAPLISHLVSNHSSE